MSKTGHILVLDVGTTGVKAFVFDRTLRPLACALTPLSKKRPRAGWVTQDPSELLRASVWALRTALRRSGVAARSLSGISITNQRETTILWDARSGRPVYPAIVWEDRRTAALCRRLTHRYASAVRRKTGLPIEPYFSATKINWVLAHVSAARALSRAGNLRFGTVDSWVLWHLLEGRPHITDYTNASRTLLFNIRKLTWDRGLLDLFKIPAGLLPEVLPSRAAFGTLKREVIGRALPVLAVCGDQQASLFAAGLKTGTTKVTYGTGTFITQILGPRFRTRPSFYTTLAPGKRPVYALEAKIEGTGARVAAALKAPRRLHALIARLTKGVARYLRRLPLTPRSVVIDGGITQAKELAALQSEAASLPVRKQKMYDGTALGAALLARRRS